VIKVGTSGFRYADWKGVVYPEGIKSAEMLPYLEQEFGFHASEINFTYYSMPGTRTFRSLAEKSSPGMDFSVKAHQTMTHRLPETAGERADVFARFAGALQPLEAEGKLACVLAQFPYRFAPSPQAYSYLAELRGGLAGLPVSIELRNAAWDKQHEALTAFLREHELGYCAVDLPRLEPLPRLQAEVTAEPAYLRLHGRNTNWFRAPASVRYDYLYSDEELREFLPHIAEMERRAAKTLVFFNNCHRGQAALNGRTLLRMLEEEGLLGELDKLT
jgi:uncharacterized protein YecE (DUF72 family)